MKIFTYANSTAVVVLATSSAGRTAVRSDRNGDDCHTNTDIYQTIALATTHRYIR